MFITNPTNVTGTSVGSKMQASDSTLVALLYCVSVNCREINLELVLFGLLAYCTIF